ncbi:hypothetical protein K5I29_06515 [Flavobacterium agricola]|uniref:Uncharacterized protein n=1 Tax=Flavobacterium agricola TaxID=2870839 RepID=A0ABY6M2L3_9FLAO|nr:hypothetical protein [Flavobacterium agricola]UYW02522.1 hypothetical protein K5I29_06515 [Flavobacterium agricola]
MKVLPAIGIGDLVFGMKTKDVEQVLGKPNKAFEDEDGNKVYLYNAYKARLTFYADEDFKFGYVICTHPKLELSGIKLFNENAEKVKKELTAKGMPIWEEDDIDTMTRLFNEKNWLTLVAEYEEIICVELGATIDKSDNFVWKFKK